MGDLWVLCNGDLQGILKESGQVIYVFEGYKKRRWGGRYVEYVDSMSTKKKRRTRTRTRRRTRRRRRTITNIAAKFPYYLRFPSSFSGCETQVHSADRAPIAMHQIFPDLTFTLDYPARWKRPRQPPINASSPNSATAPTPCTSLSTPSTPHASHSPPPPPYQSRI